MKENEVLNEKIVEKEYKKGERKAERIIDDTDKVEKILQKLERKLKKIPYLGEEFSIVPTMISLVRSYIKKEYTEIPLESIVGMVSALTYILSPIDLIPDGIPVIGYLDDVSVLLVCLKTGAKDDIEEYQKWRDENNKNID